MDNDILTENRSTAEELIEQERGWKSYLAIGFCGLLLLVALYYMKGWLQSNASSLNRDFTEAYMMGDPFNGKIVYKNYETNGMFDFSVKNMKTGRDMELGEFKINTDPTYGFGYVGENILTLTDLVTLHHSISYNTATGKQTTDMVGEDSARPGGHYFLMKNVRVFPAMGIEGNERIESTLDGPTLKQMGASDFAGYQLKYSYWVWDGYAGQLVTDKKTGGHLALIVMQHDFNDSGTEDFFALVDSSAQRMIWTGYPNHLIHGSWYVKDYMLNCRQEGTDHLVILSRDKVYRLQISTGVIETIGKW